MCDAGVFLGEGGARGTAGEEYEELAGVQVLHKHTAAADQSG